MANKKTLTTRLTNTCTRTITTRKIDPAFINSVLYDIEQDHPDWTGKGGWRFTLDDVINLQEITPPKYKKIEIGKWENCWDSTPSTLPECLDAALSQIHCSSGGGISPAEVKQEDVSESDWIDDGSASAVWSYDAFFRLAQSDVPEWILVNGNDIPAWVETRLQRSFDVQLLKKEKNQRLIREYIIRCQGSCFYP
jgi:hypothetical protein